LKWCFTGHGAPGLIKNIDLVKVLRETLGFETEIMFDAFMGWELDYAIAWAKAAEQYRPRFLEEPFMPHQTKLFEKLAESTSIPVATGEHLYNRWEILDYMRTKSVSVYQPDPEWCGGVSELVKMCTLASAFGVQVMPHGHNLHAAMHVIAAQSPAVCPYGEYLLNKMDHHYMFEKNPPMISNGKIALNNRPGFGIEWDDSKIQKKQKVSFE
jgi:L-rhamnonate dehydratase